MNGLERAIGLTAQVQAFRRRAGFYRVQSDVDALVSAGANDGLDFLDQGLIDIVLDEVAVLGALLLTSTPLVVSKSEQLDSRSANNLKAMVNGVSRCVMRMLAREYRRQDSVAVIDAKPLRSKIVNPELIDPVHPSSQASGELSELFVSKVSARLPGFGFG